MDSVFTIFFIVTFFALLVILATIGLIGQDVDELNQNVKKLLNEKPTITEKNENLKAKKEALELKIEIEKLQNRYNKRRKK